MKKKLVLVAILAMVFTHGLFADDTYTPPPESAGGWRTTKTPEEVRSLGGMDPDKLNLIRDKQLGFSLDLGKS